MLSLLADDVAHIPPDDLERAIERHVVSSPYMPKAADLIKLAQDNTKPMSIGRAKGQSYAQALADRNNQTCTRDDIEWAVDHNEQVYLRHRNPNNG